MEDVFLDNLPDTANMILNILWDNNREMSVEELTKAVNERYVRRWENRDIKEFADFLVRVDYIERRRKWFKTYYIALGSEALEELEEE